MIGEGGDAHYVAFMGTKQRRDLITNANMVQEVLWPEEYTGEGNPMDNPVRSLHCLIEFLAIDCCA